MDDFRADHLSTEDSSLVRVIFSLLLIILSTIKEKEAQGHEFERDQEGEYLEKDEGRKGKMV